MLAIRLRALGDVVLTTPALRALHRGHPARPLDVLTDERYVGLLRGLPGVERVIGLRRGRGAMFEAIGAVRRRRYGTVIDFFGNPRSAALTALSGARDTYGYDVRGRRYAYRRRIPRDAPVVQGRREYAAATHVRLARAAGGVDAGLHAHVVVGDEARAEAERLLRTAGIATPERAIGLVAAGTWGTKTWPASHAGWLARELIAGGGEVLLLAGPGEERVTRVVRELAPGIAVLPPCDVPTLAAVIARLAGVIGTDSGPRHLAAALGRPTFAWFGPTNPDNWTPPGDHGVWWAPIPCRGCNLTSCPHWICLPSLDPREAARLVREHFEHPRAPFAPDLHAPADLGPAARA